MAKEQFKVCPSCYNTEGTFINEPNGKPIPNTGRACMPHDKPVNCQECDKLTNLIHCILYRTVES